MRKNLFSLTIALACMATAAWAQIAVPPGGTTLTFDVLPVTADGWSTLSVGGGGNTILTVDALDAAVQTQTAAGITTALGSSSTWPPSTQGIARWNSAHMLIQTRPTGNAYLLLLGTMVNNTASPVTSLGLQYEYGVYDLVTEECPGQRVFWSTTGNANDWHLIESLSGITTAGTLTANLDLSGSPWAAGATMYLLWVDDNGDGSTDGSYTIDNLMITPAGSSELAVSVVPGNTAPTAVLQCGTITFRAFAGGGTGPYSYQWMKDGGDLEGQTSETLVLSNVQASDAGGYSVRVVDSATPPGLTWWDPPSQLEVTPNTSTPTLVGASGTDFTTITVHFSKPVNITGTGAIVVREVNTPANTIAVTDATVSGTNVILTTATRGKLYEVVVQAGAVTDSCNGSAVAAGSSATVIETAILMPFNHVWSYDQSGVEAEAGWSNTVYAAADSWPTGPGVFDMSTTARTVVGGNPVGTTLSLHTTGGAYDVDDIPTYYFRTHFNFPVGVDPAQSTVTLHTQFDDAGIIYVNGREIWRTTGMTWSETTEPFAVYSGTALGNGAIANVNVPASDFIDGDNVVVVYLKQVNATSSDITMGLQISTVISNFFVTGGPLQFTVNPTTANVPQCGTLNLSATVQGGTRQYSYQWYHGSTALTDGQDGVSGATTLHLSIANIQPAQAGNYSLHVVDGAAQPGASADVPVTVIAETAPTIVSAVSETDKQTVTVKFSTAVQISSATGGDFLVRAEDGSGDLGLAASTVTNNNEVILTTTEALQQKNYRVVVQGSGVTAPCSGLHVADGAFSRIAQKMLIFGLELNNEWQYNDAGVDLQTAWLANGYDDHQGDWATGAAVLDGKTTPRTTVSGQTVGTQLSLTNETTYTTAHIPTYYFRKHFTPPAPLAEMSLSCRTFFDDYGIIYINGVEVNRSTNVVATNELFATYLEKTAVGDANFSPEIQLPKTDVVAGDNVIAVYLKQDGPGSSDITMGLELIATVTNFVTGPRLTIVNNGNGSATISWNPAGGTLQESTDLRNWADAATQTNPQTRTMTGRNFFRVR